MILIRKTERSCSYYSVALYPTLFDEFMVVHHCGRGCSSNATKEYFETKKEALLKSLHIIASQKERGFILQAPRK